MGATVTQHRDRAADERSIETMNSLAPQLAIGMAQVGRELGGGRTQRRQQSQPRGTEQERQQQQ